MLLIHVKDSNRRATALFVRRAMSIFTLLWMVAPLASLSAESTTASVAMTSPIGLWETIDDRTGRPGAVVQIFEKDGRLFGRIEHLFTPGSDNRVCSACTDDRKDQLIVGLIIIRNIKTDGNEYNGGDILDPDSGSVYRCKMHLEQSGSRLIVRGYIGFSLIGRSQTWHRKS